MTRARILHRWNALGIGAVTIGMLTASAPGAPTQPVVTLADGGPLVCLDAGEGDARALGIADAVADFARCFERMTGHALPRTGGTRALFDPTRPRPTRFECRVTGMRDRSRCGGPTAQVGLALSPTPRFDRGPLAGPGEKVAWTCTWDRPGKVLAFQLTVANKAYYGPGYGPFTFAELKTQAPDFGAGGSLRLALECRNAEDGCLRGSYSIDGGAWVSSDWFDPAAAGTDEREPGKSDKNGPQAWAGDWAERWRGATAFYLTAYHPKGRQASVIVDRVRVTRDSDILFSSDFSPPADGQTGWPEWALCPAAGTARPQDGAVLFEPELGGWCTVGLRAQQPSRMDRDTMAPLRVELQEFPAGVSHFDAHTVQGFEIEAGEDGVVLRAYTALGLQHALYHLLDHWGCRWVMPGELGECTPTRKRLTFPHGVTRFAPHADMAVDTSPFGEWHRRNLSGWHNWLSGQHYWRYAIPPDKHFAEHPEWFALVGGERQPKQLCSTNPEVVARVIEVAKSYLRRVPRAASFPLDPNDNIDFCQCATCTALDVPGAVIRGAPSVTDRVLTFVNAVAGGIREEFPDRYVAFYAYWTHIDPPVRVKPAGNVVVIVCRSRHCLLHLTPNESCPTSDFHAFVSRWKALTPNIYAYEYDPVSWTGGLPCPTYLSMAKSLKTLFNQVGIKGSYSDGAQYAAHASTYVNRYIARRMKVDPTREPEEVLRDMCRHFFGPAAEPMERYYRELAKVTRSDHAGRQRLSGGSTFYHEIFTPDIVRAGRTCLDQAVARCGEQAPYRQRLEMVGMSQRYLEAYLGGIWNAQRHQHAAAVAAFDRMDTVIDEMEGPGYLDAPDARHRAKTMRLKALAEHFPEKQGFVTRWRLLGPLDNSDRNAHVRRDNFEPVRSVDQPVTRDDGTVVDWFGYESPGGLLNLEQAFADRPRTWTLSYAYAGKTVEVPEPVVAQLKMDSFFPFRVFVNGEEAFHRLGLNADCPDRHIVDARLKAGTNTIVVKLSQTQLTGDGFPWGLYLRVEATGRDAAVLPDQWAFKQDPRDVGRQEKWYASALDESDWRAIRVPSAWEETVGPYDGFAWYRARFAIPAELKGQRLVLKFGGADEQAWVYLNGQRVGERTTESTGKTVGEIWNVPFELPVPAAHVRWGAPNLLAVRVHDSKFAGGLFRGVRLVVGE